MNRPTDLQALHLGLALARSHARQQQRLDEHLGMWHGIGQADFLLLDALSRSPHDRLATLALAKQLYCPPSALVRQLLPLEKTGLLAREAGAVHLRAAGRQLHAEASQTVGAVCGKAWNTLRLDGEAFDTLLSQLDAVAAATGHATPEVHAR